MARGPPRATECGPAHPRPRARSGAHELGASHVATRSRALDPDDGGAQCADAVKCCGTLYEKREWRVVPLGAGKLAASMIASSEAAAGAGARVLRCALSLRK
eukprot:scaffold2315_cov145-Isochrysis_galbana.AAC.11